MGYPKNYVVYADGMGFLTETSRPDFFFVSVIGEAATFRKSEAEEMCKVLCEDYRDVWVLKKCSDFQSSKNMQ